MGKLKKLINNRPKYQIADEYNENLAMSKVRAFGKDRGVQMAEENIDRGVGQAIGQAKQLSGSTTSLLDTLRSVTESGFEQKRGLAETEAALQNQRMGELYNANTALAEEKDKEWNFNVNEPYQLKIQELREKRKARQEALYRVLDMAGTIGGAFLGGPAGAAIGSNLGKAAKSTISYPGTA